MKFLVLLCLTILWTMFIVSFSMQTGEESSQVADVMQDSVGVLCGCVVVSLVCKKFLKGD